MPKFNYDLISAAERMSMVNDQLRQAERNLFGLELNQLMTDGAGGAVVPGVDMTRSTEDQKQIVEKLREMRDGLQTEIDKDKS